MSGPAPKVLTTPADAPLLRLDVWLTQHFPEESRAAIQRWLKDGHVQRHTPTGLVVEANPAKKIRPHETYTIQLPAIADSTLVPETMDLRVVFEDADLIVLDKPAGLAVHPSKGHSTGTLVHGLLAHCGASLSGLNGEARPGIVHRLDKDTSGLLVVAKHDVAHRKLARQFAAHTNLRRYVALVRGAPTPAAGTLTSAIGRHPVHRLRRAVVPDGTPSAKLATTHYETLRTFAHPDAANNPALKPVASLLQLTLKTGRTHQIRVHMAQLGHPVLGDALYGPPGALPGHADLVIPARQLLHAATLGFVHPRTNQWMQWESALPPEMVGVVQLLNAT